MDGLAHHDEGLRPTRLLRLAAVFLAALVVVAAAGAAAVVLWARTYTPLEGTTGAFAPGPGLGAAIPPALGSGGREVFFPTYRKGRDFLASFTLHNSGHFSVTVDGLEPATAQTPPWIGPVALLSTESVSSNAPAAHTRPFRPLVLAAGDTAVVVARFRMLCPAGRRRAPSVFADSLRLRYSYLRWFSRTQTVQLPFAVTLRCVGGPLAQP